MVELMLKIHKTGHIFNMASWCTVLSTRSCHAAKCTSRCSSTCAVSCRVVAAYFECLFGVVCFISVDPACAPALQLTCKYYMDCTGMDQDTVEKNTCRDHFMTPEDAILEGKARDTHLVLTRFHTIRMHVLQCLQRRSCPSCIHLFCCVLHPPVWLRLPPDHVRLRDHHNRRLVSICSMRPCDWDMIVLSRMLDCLPCIQDKSS